MPEMDGPGERAVPAGSDVAEEIVRRAPQDLVFVMRFLGESQYRMLRGFQEFIRTEAASRGATAEEYPLFAHFVDAHAAELRDFVFNGVALSRHFRVGEIEFLTRDTEALLRVDVPELAEEPYRDRRAPLPSPGRAVAADAGGHGNGARGPGAMSRPVHEIIAERMALVTEAAALNSRQLRNSQLVGGAEIEDSWPAAVPSPRPRRARRRSGPRSPAMTRSRTGSRSA